MTDEKLTFGKLNDGEPFEYIHYGGYLGSPPSLKQAEKVEKFAAGDRMYNALTIGRDSFPIKKALLLTDNLQVVRLSKPRLVHESTARIQIFIKEETENEYLDFYPTQEEQDG